MSADEILDDRNFCQCSDRLCLGGLWHLVLTMTAILATGAALPLAPGPAAFSGLLAGVFAALQRPASPRSEVWLGLF